MTKYSAIFGESHVFIGPFKSKKSNQTVDFLSSLLQTNQLDLFTLTLFQVIFCFKWIYKKMNWILLFFVLFCILCCTLARKRIFRWIFPQFNFPLTQYSFWFRAGTWFIVSFNLGMNYWSLWSRTFWFTWSKRCIICFNNVDFKSYYFKCDFNFILTETYQPLHQFWLKKMVSKCMGSNWFFNNNSIYQ